MSYFKAFGYISYVIELLTLAATYKSLPPDLLGARVADVVYRAVDQGLRGKASRAIDRVKLVESVQQVINVVLDVMD